MRSAVSEKRFLAELRFGLALFWLPASQRALRNLDRSGAKGQIVHTSPSTNPFPVTWYPLRDAECSPRGHRYRMFRGLRCFVCSDQGNIERSVCGCLRRTLDSDYL